MSEISHVIYMEPVPKGRPRTTTVNGHSQTYTPKETVHAENLIRDEIVKFLLDSGQQGVALFGKDEPLWLEATFYRSRPKSVKRRLPTCKPDWDNYAKLLTDALETFLYNNDSQITTATIKKRYGFPPRIQLHLKLDPADDLDAEF